MPSNAVPPAPPSTLTDVIETDRFLRALLDNACVVCWKKPPTIEALDAALAGFEAIKAKNPGRVGLAVVSLTHESPAPEVNAYAAKMTRQWGPATAILVMAQEARGFSSKINRVLLRTLMATMGALSQGPRRALFVDTPQQAFAALEAGLSELGMWTRPGGELARAGEWMIARCQQTAS